MDLLIKDVKKFQDALTEGLQTVKEANPMLLPLPHDGSHALINESRIGETKVTIKSVNPETGIVVLSFDNPHFQIYYEWKPRAEEIGAFLSVAESHIGRMSSIFETVSVVK